MLKKQSSVKLYDKIILGAIFLLCFFFFSHPDLWETANHSYVLLESIFKGKFLNFYEIVAQHNNSYYYINNANYNIVLYLIFAIWELPVFIFNNIFSFALNESVLIYWAKFLCCGFYVGCGFMLYKLCLNLNMDDKTSKLAAFFFLINPIALFSPFVMGQYDTLCLFFLLWALQYYVKKQYTKFSLIIGIGAVFKFFPLLIFFPLILLAEKKILHLAKYFLCSLWLYIPSSLLFLGRTEEAGVFTQSMIDRLFVYTADSGIRPVSVFTLLYAILIFVCFIYTPKNENFYTYAGTYLPLVIFGLLFICISWHPQWMVLLVPFIVITTFMQENKAPWFWLDIIFCAGYFMNCFYMFPNQTGGILLDGGLLAHLGNMRIALQSNWMLVDEFLSHISYVYVLTPVCFIGSILLNCVFKFYNGKKTIADSISISSKFDAIPTKLFAYIIFVSGFIIMWFIPSLCEWLNAFEIILIG